MTRSSATSILAACCLCACHAYTPQPVDLEQHARAFLDRGADAVPAAGLTRSGGREIAKAFHPEARLARRRAGVATARRDQSDRWPDPQLQTNVQYILETLPHRWVPMAQIGFTIPINGRLRRQRERADRARDEALVTAWATEQRVANDLDRAWAAWSAARLRVQQFERTCELLAQLAQVASQLADAGQLTKPSARIFALELTEQQIAATAETKNARALQLAVLQALGLHPDTPVELAPSLAIEPFAADSDARGRALRDSPRLLASELAHATAEADLHLQIVRQYPDITLWPGWQEEDAQPRAGFGFNLPLPVFTGNDPEIARARAEREVTAATLRATFEQLVQELAIAEIQRDATREQADRFADLEQMAARQLADSGALQAAGQFDPLMQLDAVVRLHEVRLLTITALEATAMATITINDLLTDPRSRPIEESR